MARYRKRYKNDPTVLIFCFESILTSTTGTCVMWV